MKMNAEWITDKYILVMLALFPLFTGTQGYTSITAAKFYFFAGATGVWLLCLALALSLQREKLRRPGALSLCALLFILAALASTFFSEYREAAWLGGGRWDGLLTLSLYALIFLCVSRFARPRARYVYALALSVTLCSLVAVLQLRKINVLGLFPNNYTYYDSGMKYTGAFLGTIGNTNLLAAFYCLALPLLGFRAIFHERRAELWLLLPFFLGAYVLARSGVASGAVGMLCAFGVGLPVALWFKRGKRAALLSLVAEGAFLLLCLVLLYFFPPEGGTLWELSELLHGRVEPGFGSSRILIWRETLSLVPEHLLLGGGPDSFGARTELGFSRFVQETGITLSVHVDNAHNEYLNYLVNIGLLGLLPYLALCLGSFAAALRKKTAESLALACALAGYFAQSFFGLGLCLVVPILWIFMGLAAGRAEEAPAPLSPAGPVSETEET